MSDVSSSSDNKRSSENSKEGEEEVTTTTNNSDSATTNDDRDDDVESYNSNIDSDDDDDDEEDDDAAPSPSTPSPNKTTPPPPAQPPLQTTTTLTQPTSNLFLRPSILKPPRITVTSSSETASSSSSGILKPSKLTLQKEEPANKEEKEAEKVIQSGFVPLDQEHASNGDNGEPAVNSGGSGSSGSSSGGFLFGENVGERAEVAENNSTAGTSESSNKRKIDVVIEETQVVSGEEGEINVLQIPIRLYVFNNVTQSSQNWSERVSRGLLRLNDIDADNSRLIVRTQGSLRLALNAKLFNGMKLERASEKSLKFTGNDDDGEIKIFLVMGSQSDIESLQLAMENRLRKFSSVVVKKLRSSE